MALTQSAWSVKTVNRRTISTCTVAGTDDADLMTLRTPTSLDGTKPFSLVVNVPEDLTAAGAAALDIWGGYADNCSLAAADAGTNCVLVHANSTDLDSGGTLVINVFPGIDGTLTQVTNASPGTALIPPYPYYIFNLDLTAGLEDAATITYTVIQ